ncbi:transporter substrate-binding domain-containing protein [Xylanibacter ruminicola]|uniref:Solute-binding protein family 3/N-terminal domain-containing protein n=1 Tax=Xylanibacter ruminicola TaxID=839 RepID=A0A1M6W2E5_XYLRU|nr:hypothetical protein [Xylanibacter ruminicola]SHK87788.1 hypothetical protein SAMN05216463_1156 [Xylanibacter ruminicola]
MKMIHRQLTAIILLLAVATSAAAQSLSERYPTERPVIIVCNYKKPAGYYLDVANKMAEKIGVKLKFETQMGDAGWDNFVNGEADLILTNNEKYDRSGYTTSKSIVDYQRVSADSITEMHLTGKDRQLMEQIDDTYMRMKQNGEIEEIQQRWLHPEKAKTETPKTVIHLANALLILSAILIVLGLMRMWHIHKTRKHTAEIKEMINQAQHMHNSYVYQDDKAAHDLKLKYDAIMCNPFVAIAFYDKNGRLVEMNETMKRTRHENTAYLRQPLYNADGEVSNYIVAVDKRKLTT